MAPEAIMGKPYGAAADMWSLGVLLFTMLCGQLPFRGSSSLHTLAAVCLGKADFGQQPWHSISLQAKRLVYRMLSLDPLKRPTAAQVAENQWVQGKVMVAQGMTEC